MPLLQRFVEFIETVLLVEMTQPIVLFFDEIDSMLKFDFKDDFFALIRACYEQRTEQPDYHRLTFALLGVATPADLIQDKSRTPFNIGRAIALEGFQLHEAHPLLPGLTGNAENPQEVLRAVLSWTGGQPFLTQKLCQLMLDAPVQITAGNEAEVVERVVRSRLLDNWEAQDEPEHLRTIRDRLLYSSGGSTGRLLELYQQILQQGDISADHSPEQMALRLTGLVVQHQEHLQSYNPIYQAVFDQQWVEAAFASIRPYAAQIQAWLESTPHNDEHLLQGAPLETALAWAESRSLSQQDYQYLVESQKLGLRRELSQMQTALEQTTQQLAERNQTLSRINQELDTARQELDTAQRALDTTRQELDISRQELDTARRELHTAQEELNRVRRRTRRVTVLGVGLVGLLTLGAGWATREAWAQRNVAEEAIAQKEDALDGLKEIRTEKDGLAQQKETLEQQQKTLQTANQMLDGKNDTLEQTNITLEQQNRQITQEVAQAKTAQQTAQHQANAAQRERTQAQNDAEAAREEAKAAQQNAEAVQARAARQERNLEDVFQITAAVSTFAQENPEEAMAQLSRMLEANPDNAAGWVVRGELHMQSKNPDRALEDFNRAIALEPDNFTAHVGRGDALMAFELPQREDAIAAYDRAIVLNPNYHQAWANRGIALTSSGQLIEAVESYNRALEIDIDGNDAVDNLKETLNSLIETWFSGSAANSINLSRATTVTVNDPDQESESYRVGPSISTGFDLDDEDAETIAAASALLLQRDPQDADAFYYQGFSLIVTEQYTAAIEQLNRALTLRPEFPEAYITRGLARKRQGDEEGAIADLKLAIADYTRAIEHKPEDDTCLGVI
jgi:tetratricopeptide (TPR) repeat protein